MELGKTIKAYRNRSKITLKELADRVGTTASFLSDIENSKKQPSIDTLSRLAEAFGIPIYMLFKTAPMQEAAEDIHCELEQGATTTANITQDAFILQAKALFLSEALSKEDKEAIYKDITDLYWKAKGWGK